MAEEIDVQPEAITEEEPQIGFLDKLKIYKFKILGGILGAFVLAGAVFGVYKFRQRQVQLTPQLTPTAIPSPSPDLTADWKGYMNFSLGISFKYPENWNVELVESTLHINPQEGSFTIVAYSIDDQTLRATKETYVTTDTQTVIQRRIDHTEYDITEYTLTFKGVPGAGRSTIIDIVEYKDGAFLWQLSDLQFKEIFNLILSTFRFLEDESCGEMSLLEAAEIALESECVEEGNLTDEYFCNDYTGTWWIDLDIEKPGCAPACVINVSSGEAEINWRCTGLIEP